MRDEIVKQIAELETYIAGSSVIAGDMIIIEIIFRNSRTVTLTEELKKLKIRQGLFSIEIAGRFNYIKVSRFAVDLIRFYLGVATIDEKRSVEDVGIGNGEKGVGAFYPEMDRVEQDKNRKRNPYNI